MNSVRKIKENTFGGFLHALRKSVLLSFDDFRIALGVTKTYLNDVETDFVRAPTPKMQMEMARILCEKKRLSDDDIHQLFDLAAAARGELPADIYYYLINNPSAIDGLRGQPEYSAYVQKSL